MSATLICSRRRRRRDESYRKSPAEQKRVSHGVHGGHGVIDKCYDVFRCYGMIEDKLCTIIPGRSLPVSLPALSRPLHSFPTRRSSDLSTIFLILAKASLRPASTAKKPTVAP